MPIGYWRHEQFLCWCSVRDAHQAKHGVDGIALNQKFPHIITPRAQWIVVVQLSNTRLQNTREYSGCASKQKYQVELPKLYQLMPNRFEVGAQCVQRASGTCQQTKMSGRV